MFKRKSVPLLWVLTLMLMVSTLLFISCPEPDSRLPAVAPMISPNGGTVSSTKTIEITTTTENASIYYTLNGDEPTESSTPYTGPFTLPSSDITVKAIAAHTNFLLSPVTTSAPFTLMTRLAAPTISKESGELTTHEKITISTTPEDDDIKIYYTLNGETPTTSNIKYTNPINISVCTKIEAIAVKEGYDNSPPVSEIYTVLGPAGGLVFYDKGDDNNGWRYLEAAPADLIGLGSLLYEWGIKGLVTNTEIAAGTGSANTLKIIASHADATESAPAAEACADYSLVSEEITYDDWFLPSKDELNLMYQNLKSNGLGEFAEVYYWSSSEVSENTAWLQFFNDGYQQSGFSKNTDYSVRPVRAYSLRE